MDIALVHGSVFVLATLSIAISVYSLNALRRRKQAERLRYSAPPDFWADLTGRGFYRDEHGRWKSE